MSDILNEVAKRAYTLAFTVITAVISFYFMFETVCIVALANVNILFEIVINRFEVDLISGMIRPKFYLNPN